MSNTLKTLLVIGAATFALTGCCDKPCAEKEVIVVEQAPQHHHHKHHPKHHKHAVKKAEDKKDWSK